MREFKERELDGAVMLIDDHANKSQQHRYQFTKRSSARRTVLGDLFSRLLPDAESPGSGTSENGHIGHFVALPIPGENKCEENR